MAAKKDSKVPEIRFRGNEKKWQKTSLHETSATFSGGTPSVGKKDYYGGEISFIRSAEINSTRTELKITNCGLNESAAKMVSKGDILYALYGATSGEVGISKIEGAINQAILAIRPNSSHDTRFIEKWLRREKENIVATYLQGGQGNLSGEIIKSLDFFRPEIREQIKIGNYFKELDELIRLHQRKYDKLMTLKQSMFQKMFPKDGAIIPEIRFSGFEGDWKERSLREISRKTTEKNTQREYAETFTNSAELGVVSQRDYFDKDISNTENIDGYYIVRPEDFVYNPRISSFAPVGPINRNKLGRIGIMSPLYTVFTTKDVDNTFLEYFFKTRLWHPFMHFNGDTGARADRFSIKDAVFMELPVAYPELAEQQKIGTYFRKLDTLISQQATQLTKLKQIKAACLEKMFV